MSNKTAGKVEKAGNALFKIYRGCGWLLINFFVLIFLCWGLYASFVGYRVETNGETVQGHVVDLDMDDGTYTAIFEFEVDGQAYRFRDDSSSYPAKYELGEGVMVRYDRANPNRAHLDGILPAWLFPVGMVITLIGALIGVNIWGWVAWKRGEEMIDLL